MLKNFFCEFVMKFENIFSVTKYSVFILPILSLWNIEISTRTNVVYIYIWYQYCIHTYFEFVFIKIFQYFWFNFVSSNCYIFYFIFFVFAYLGRFFDNQKYFIELWHLPFHLTLVKKLNLIHLVKRVQLHMITLYIFSWYNIKTLEEKIVLMFNNTHPFLNLMISYNCTICCIGNKKFRIVTFTEVILPASSRSILSLIIFHFFDWSSAIIPRVIF